MESIPVLGWYLALLRREARPRDPNAAERDKLDTILYGGTQPRTGTDTINFALKSLGLGIGIVGSIYAGMWVVAILIAPIFGYCVAGTIGRAREGYYWR